jgi:hypothetical protein
MRRRSAYESGKIRAVLQASLEPYAKYKDVPLAISFVKNDLARQLVTVADSAHGAQFPYTVRRACPRTGLNFYRRRSSIP